jgi:hypothetical protein
LLIRDGEIGPQLVELPTASQETVGHQAVLLLIARRYDSPRRPRSRLGDGPVRGVRRAGLVVGRRCRSGPGGSRTRRHPGRVDRGMAAGVVVPLRTVSRCCRYMRRVATLGPRSIATATVRPPRSVHGCWARGFVVHPDHIGTDPSQGPPSHRPSPGSSSPATGRRGAGCRGSASATRRPPRVADPGRPPARITLCHKPSRLGPNLARRSGRIACASLAAFVLPRHPASGRRLA